MTDLGKESAQPSRYSLPLLGVFMPAWCYLARRKHQQLISPSTAANPHLINTSALVRSFSPIGKCDLPCPATTLPTSAQLISPGEGARGQGASLTCAGVVCLRTAVTLGIFCQSMHWESLKQKKSMSFSCFPSQAQPWLKSKTHYL